MLYLDHNATTPLRADIALAMAELQSRVFANPSASYRAGREAARVLADARARVATALRAEPEHVIFTSGGTEANNTIIESAWQQRGTRTRLIIGATEHPAILEPAKRWAARGGELSIVRVDRFGIIDLKALESLLAKEDTALVSVMWANNETGTLAPMADIVRLAHTAGVPVHSDAVQAFGKVPLDVQVDYLSISAHKFNGPKGIGALYVHPHARFTPLMLGGGQERGLRSGTENVIGAHGMAMAAAFTLNEAMRAVRDAFEQRVIASTGAIINGHRVQRLPNTSSLTFSGVDAAALMILLDEQGLACSAGSACHSAALHPSQVLAAMGCDADHARSTLRFSFGHEHSINDAVRAAEVVIAAVARAQELNAGGCVVSMG
jgi:cysteine desulfurase